MSFAPLFALVFLLITTTANASPMSNEDVASMLRAGMNEATVIQAVEASDGKFDTSANGLIALKKAGATDAVLQKIIAKNAPAPKATATTSAVSGLVACAETPGDVPSIAIHDGDRELYIAYEEGKASSSISPLSIAGAALTLGIVPVTGRAGITLSGPRSATRVTSRAPKLSYIMMPSTMAPSNYGSGINLVHFKQAGSSRALNFMEGKIGVFGAGEEDTTEKYNVPVNFSAEGPNCTFHGKEETPVIVEPQAPLVPGEYAILQVVGPEHVVFYAFGVD